MLTLAALLLCAACFEPTAVNCAQYVECPACTMVAECSFCLETNQCIADSQVCGGDRAQLPDMCEGE